MQTLNAGPLFSKKFEMITKPAYAITQSNNYINLIWFRHIHTYENSNFHDLEM